MNHHDLITRLRANAVVGLPKIGRWQPSAHAFDEPQLNALEAALGAGRPLLVRGEPGLGKSQIARAVAAAWQWRLVTASIHSRTERDDLLYSIDHVQRLSQSRAGAAGELQDHIQPGPVWRAMKPVNDRDGVPLGPGAYPIDQNAGCVLLIDEIDKAHRDIPNALLEVLDDGEFELPFAHKDFSDRVVRAANGLFIVMTANDERDLPAAFMRRCAVLHLQLQDDAAGQLRDIALSHIDLGTLGKSVKPFIDKAISAVLDYRRDVPDGYYKPGTSEMIDLLKAIDASSVGAEQIDEAIERMREYLICKEFRSDAGDDAG